MDSPNTELVEQIASEAERLYRDIGTDQKWQLAIDEWFAAEQHLGETRPSRADVERFLKNVVKDVLRQITSKEVRLTRTTMVFVVNEFVAYLINDLHYQNLAPYRIPIGILATIVFESVMAEIASRLQSKDSG